MELTPLQESTINKILDLYSPEKTVTCEFKAPTGSGKTLMASYFISSMIERNPDEKFIFIVATPSSSSLPYFFEQKLNLYKADLPYSKFDVEYIKSPSTGKKGDKNEYVPRIIAELNKVYIFGKSSFGSKRILSEYKIIDDFIVDATDKNYRLIYIRDEAHIGGESKDNGKEARDFENLMTSNAAFILKMTATPDFKNPNTIKIVLKESDLNNPSLNEGKWLLKTQSESLLKEDLEDTKVLKHAITQFQNIKNEYLKLNKNIHPAMLIQIDNDAPSDKVKQNLFKDTLEKIKKILDANTISWVQYFGNNDKDSNRVYKDKFSLDDISRNNSDIDAVIFKIGPSTGWDIPRACMLVQLRDVCSKNLNIQTLGRIKRNPYPGLEKNEITDKYYVYSNVENSEVKEYTYQVREKFIDETFLSIDIDNKKDIISSKSFEKFEKPFEEWLGKDKNHILETIGNSFIDGGRKYKTIRKFTNGHQIYSIESNPFRFLKGYKKLISANKILYNAIKNTVKTFCKRVSKQKEFVFTVLLSQYKGKIREILFKTRSCKPTYKIMEQKYDPRSYCEIFSKEQRTIRVSKRDYLFDINEHDFKSSNKQPLDSEPEEVIFNKILDFAEIHDKAIKLWAKNQKTSNIFGEYLDDAGNIRKSYFDFIIKFENNVYLYIEVKSEQDIDPEKAEQLKAAYEDYFKNKIYGLFDNHKIVIVICRVDSKGNVRFSDNIFYDKDHINPELNLLSFDELLKKLADIKY